MKDVSKRSWILNWFLLSLLAFGQSARADLLAYDAFDYAPGLIDGLNGGFGFSDPWTASSLGPSPLSTVSSGGLTYTDSAGKVLVTSGNRLSVYNQETPRNLTTTGLPSGIVTAGSFGAPGSTLYVSFLANLQSGTAAGSYSGLSVGKAFFGNPGYANRVYWGVDPQLGADGIQESAVPVDSTTRFLVGRIDFGTTTDTVRLYVDPTLSNEPTTATVAPFSMPHFTFGRIKPTSGGATAPGIANIDELRIGTTYADVAPTVPTPAKTYVLSVGVSDSRLKGALSAERVASAFEQRQGTIAVTKQMSLSPGNANRQSLIDSINTARSQVRPGDTFVFYINSHTFYEVDAIGMDEVVNAQYDASNLSARDLTNAPMYFVLSSDNLGTRAVNNLTDDDFTQLFRDPAWSDVNKLFIIDTCFAGGFWGSKAAPDGGDLVSVPKSSLIGASAAGDVSFATEGDDGNIVGNLGTSVVSALDALRGQSFNYSDLFREAYVAGARFRGIDGYIQDDLNPNWLVKVSSNFDLASETTTDFDVNAPISVPEPSYLVCAVFLYILRRPSRSVD